MRRIGCGPFVALSPFVRAGVLGWVASLGWGVVVVRMSLREQYREFCLAPVPRAAG
jgi:hypothetical protein